MPSLYDIDAEYRILAAMIEDSGGELTDELEAALSINDTEFARKAEAYAAMIREFEADAEAFAAEAKRLQDRAASKQRTADKLRTRLAAAVSARGGKCEVGTFALSIRRSESVQIENGFDASKLPDSLYRYVPATYVPDKTAIKSALKSGVTVPGAWIETRENLQIK